MIDGEIDIIELYGVWTVEGDSRIRIWWLIDRLGYFGSCGRWIRTKSKFTTTIHFICGVWNRSKNRRLRRRMFFKRCIFASRINTIEEEYLRERGDTIISIWSVHDQTYRSIWRNIWILMVVSGGGVWLLTSREFFPEKNHQWNSFWE